MGVMDVPDELWQTLSRTADVIEVMAATGFVIALVYKNRQKVAHKLGLSKTPKNIVIYPQSGQGVGQGGTVTVTKARNVESRDRLIDLSFETASWVLPDLVKHALR